MPVDRMPPIEAARARPSRFSALAEREVAEALVTTTLIQVVATATMLGLTPIAGRASAAFGVPAYMVGYQISLIYLFGAGGSAAAGKLVHRFGAIRIEQLALACFAFGLLALATASLPMAILGSAVIGVGYGVQNPASSQVLIRVAPPSHRNLVFSIKQAGVPLGGAIASLGAPALDAALGWRLGFAIAALAPLALIIHIARHAAHEAHHRAREAETVDEAEIPSLGRMPALKGPFRILSLLSLLYSSVQLALSAFIVLMLVEDCHWSLGSAAATAALVQVFGALGRVTWGYVGDRSQEAVAVLGVIGIACALGMGVLWDAPALPAPVLVALLCLIGLTASGWNGVAMAEMARNCAPRETGRIIGAVLVFTFIGVVLGPSSFAAAYSHIGSYGHTFAIFALISGVGGLAALVSALRNRPAPLRARTCG